MNVLIRVLFNMSDYSRMEISFQISCLTHDGPCISGSNIAVNGDKIGVRWINPEHPFNRGQGNILSSRKSRFMLPFKEHIHRKLHRISLFSIRMDEDRL